MSQHHQDFAASASVASPLPALSADSSRPASSSAGSQLGWPPVATPWDGIIEEEVLRDLNQCHVLAEDSSALEWRRRRRDLAARLASQYGLRTIAASPKRHQLKRKTRTPHKIAKASPVHHADVMAATDPLVLEFQASSENPTQPQQPQHHHHQQQQQQPGGGHSLTSVVDKLLTRLRHRADSN